MKGLIGILLIALLIGIFFVAVRQQKEVDQAKRRSNSSGASSLRSLEKNGDYYVVVGADLHNVGADLLGKRICVCGSIEDVRTAMGGETLLVLTEDRCYYLQVYYGSSGAVPNELRSQIKKGGLQKGSSIKLWCSVDEIAPESGWAKSALRYKSCIVKSVDRWER